MSRSVLTIPLRQHGNSVGLIIPKPYLDALGLQKGAQVDVELKNGRIEMRPHAGSSINELMASYIPEQHNYEDLLPGDIGNEIVKD